MVVSPFWASLISIVSASVMDELSLIFLLVSSLARLLELNFVVVLEYWSLGVTEKERYEWSKMMTGKR